MKQLLFTLLFCLTGATFSFSQCVVYACKNTGSWGAAYYDNITSSSDEYKRKLAKQNCVDNGGTACEFLFEDDQSGWWAIISGVANGRIIFEGKYGYATKAEAERAVRNAYRDAGGENASEISVTSFYVYTE